MKKSDFTSLDLRLIVIWSALSAVSSSAGAQQTLTWDTNGGVAGTGGTGIWNTSSTTWASGATFQAWNNSAFDNAIFGGTAGAVSLGLPVNVHNMSFIASGYTFAGNTLTLGGANPTITTSASLATFNSTVAGSNGLIKSGPGTLVLAGNNTGFSGVTTVTSGTLRIDHVNALGTSNAASDLRLNKGSSFYFNVDYAHDYTLMGSTVNVQGGEYTWSGAPTLTASTILNLNGTSGTLSGNLADTGPFVLSLTRNNTNRMTLSGNNTYSGATTVSRGTLQLDSAGALSAGSNLVFNGAAGNGGTIELTGSSGDFTRSLGTGAGQVQWTGDGGFLSHSGDRIVDIGGAGTTLNWGSGGFVPTGNRLILGTSTANMLDFQNAINLSGGIRTIQAEGGLISGHARVNGVLSGTGTLDLVGMGGGMLELTQANSYTGGTILNSGTLIVSSDGNMGDTAGGLTFNGGTLENTGSFATGRDVTLNAGGGTFQTDEDLEVSGPINGIGRLTKTGSARLTMTGSNTYTGGTTINAGTLQVGNGGTTGSIVGDVNNNGMLVFNRLDDISYDGVISGVGGLNKEGGGRLVLTGENAYTGGTTVNAGTLQVGNGGATGSILGDVSNNGTLTFNRSDDISYNGVVSGIGGLNKEGNGRLVLTGENAYTGGTTINAGTLQIGDGGTAGSIAGDVSNNGILAFNRSDDINYGGVISGSGGLTNDGWGVLTLTGDNSYTGATTINAGVLQIGDGGTTGSIVSDVTNDSVLAFNRSNDISYGGVISGIGGLNKGGGGKLILTGENSYTGGTTVSAGTLQIGDGGTTGSIVNDVSNDSVLSFNRSDDISYGGVISGVGALNKEGNGRLILTGENSYTGGTTISAGMLQIGNGSTTGSIAGNVSNNGVLAFNRSDDISYGGVVSGIGGLTKEGSQQLVLTGENTYTGITTINAGTLQIGNGGSTGSIAGDVSNNGRLAFNRSDVISYGGTVSGAGELNKEGNGSLILTGENTYTGTTTISAGVLQVGNGGTTGSIAGNVSNSSALVFNRLDATSFGGEISGAGSFEQRGAGIMKLTGANTYTGGTTITAGTLEIGDGGTTGSIAGDVSNNSVLAFNRSDDISYGGVISGSGGLNKQGGGSLVLTGENAYTGGTTISEGTLQTGDGGTTGSIAGDVSNNGTLAFNRSDAVNFGGTISGGGSVQQRGAGRLTLTGANTYTGGTTIHMGTVEIGGGGTTGSIVGDVSNNGVLTFNRSDDLSYGGIISGIGGLNKEGGGRLVLTGENVYTGGTTISTGVLQIGDGGTTGSLVGDVINNGVLAFNRSDETSFSGSISGTGSIEQQGAGRVTLAGTNAYAGDIRISGGVLQIGDGDAVGSLLGDVSNNGVLVFNHSDNISYGGTISGLGTLHKEGGGKLTLTSENVYTGGTTINAGTLQIGDGGTTGNITGDVSNNGTLAFNHSDDISYGGAISGIGGLSKESNGRLVLTGENTYTGTTTVDAGTLQIGNGGTTGSIVGDVSNNGALVFNRSDETSLGGTISGAGSVEQVGAGTLTLTGANTYTGVTIINAGTLQIGNGGTTGSIAGNVSNSSVLAFNRSDAASFGGSINGAGRIEQRGSGRLTLTGANTYTGGTTINAGTLQIGDGGTTGNIAGDVSNNGTLAFNRSDGISYAGVISGSGALNKQGGGSLVLTGENAYTGGTTINAGTLEIGEGGTTGSIVGDVSNNSILAFNRSNDISYGGVISGSGGLNKQGGGRLVLTGENAYTSGTTINAGTLQIGGGGTTGSILGDVSNNGALAFNRSDVVNFGGTISGAGSMEQRGSGTLTLTGANTYTGGTTINTGTVQVGNGGTAGSIVGDISNNGVLTFNRSDDLSYGGVVSGSGTINKDGAGTLALIGHSGGFQGTTSVNTGTLTVNGTLGGTVNVHSNARLEGSGTVGTEVVGGTIAPGNSIGTIQVSGSYTQLKGSTYEVEIDPAGSSDRVAVAGAADIQGGTVSVIPAAGNYTVGTRYTILTAAGGRTGGFDALVQSLPFIELGLAYDSNNVYLDALGRNSVSFCSIAVTYNQCVTGQAAESLGPSHSLYSAIVTLPDQSTARQAFDSLSGELHASAKGVMIEDSRFMREAVTDRIRQAFSSIGAHTSQAPGQTVQENSGTGHAFWTRAFGSFGHRAGDTNAARISRNIGGFFLGGDTLVANTLRLGIAGGYSNSSFDVNQRNSTGSSDNYHLALYGGTRWRALGLRLGTSYTWHDLETNRNIVFPGFMANAKGDYHARTAQVFGEFGYDLAFKTVSFEPFVRVAYVDLGVKRFHERSGVAALGSSKDSEDVTYTTVGMNTATMFATPGGMAARVRGTLGWRHAFDNVPTRSALAFNSGSTFVTAGTPIAEDAMVMAAGLDANITKTAILGISYTGQVFDRVVDNGIRANLDWRF